MNSWVKMALFMLVAAFLTRMIPFSEFFRNVDTLVHELSHALVTLVLSGKVMSIQLFSDQSGVTYSMIDVPWKSIPISLAGYIGASLFAVLLFLFHSRGKERAGLILVAVLAAVGLLLFVRNGYGIAWCVGFIIVTVLLCLNRIPPWLRNGYYLLVAFICLVESVIGSFIILSLSITSAGTAGDAANLSRDTFVPAVVWGILFVAFALWCAKLASGLFIKRWSAPAPAQQTKSL